MLTNPLLHFIDVLYSFIVKIGSNLQSLFILYMRLTWGHQFFLAGIKKLQNIEATAAFFTKIGIPAPTFHAYEVGIVEALGGVLLFIGLGSRLAAIPLIIVMGTAFATVHTAPLESFHFILDPHTLIAEKPYPYLMTCLLVFIFGPGRVSLDGWIKKWAENQPRY